MPQVDCLIFQHSAYILFLVLLMYACMNFLPCLLRFDWFLISFYPFAFSHSFSNLSSVRGSLSQLPQSLLMYARSIRSMSDTFHESGINCPFTANINSF